MRAIPVAPLTAIPVLTMLTILAAGAAAGCSPKGGAGLPLEVDRFRSDLADPVKHPVREGMDVDPEVMMRACEGFARENRDLLEAHFQRSLAQLPLSEVPGEASHAKLHEAREGLLEGLRQVTGVYWALHLEAEQTFRMGVSMLLPPLLSQEGLAHEQVGAWTSFFVMARPTLRKKLNADGRLSLIGDYGKADILVLTLARGQIGWTPVGFSWWRPSST